MFDRSMSVFRSIRRTVAQRFFLAVALADFFARRAFLREIVAVYSGMHKHHDARRSGREVFYVRRHVHMLEKGISMIPRRDTFAAGYIEDLVAAVEACTAADLLDTVTCGWVADTLDAYFTATEASSSPEIRRARERYKQLDVGPRSRDFLGPVPVRDPAQVTGEGLPSYDALLSLAHARQSVRWFTPPETVDRTLVDRAIALGMQAPSACNRLPTDSWSWTTGTRSAGSPTSPPAAPPATRRISWASSSWSATCRHTPTAGTATSSTWTPPWRPWASSWRCRRKDCRPAASTGRIRRQRIRASRRSSGWSDTNGP